MLTHAEDETISNELLDDSRHTFIDVDGPLLGAKVTYKVIHRLIDGDL